mgnify:FL=1
MKVGIIGSGRWASTMAWLCVENKHNVLVWEKVFEGKEESQFYKEHKNAYVDLSASTLKTTHDLAKTLNFGEYVIISILSQSVDEMMQEIKQIPGYENKKYILAMKGIEQTTGRTLSEILIDNDVNKDNICVLAGPGHPQSIVVGEKTHMVVAGYDSKMAKHVANLLTNSNFTLFPLFDVKGVEICAAAKNVYGGLGGMCVGSHNDTLRGSLMCASLAEMEKYLEAMQCLPKTARCLPLLGDYDATMYDKNSHNLTFGIELVKQDTCNPELPFQSIEGKQAVTGLIRKMINYNHQVSDAMQLRAYLLETYQRIVNGEIKPKKAVDAIEQAIYKVYSLDEN